MAEGVGIKPRIPKLLQLNDFPYLVLYQTGFLWTSPLSLIPASENLIKDVRL